MGFPSRVNLGANNANPGLTSITPALPASRVNGNLLIAEVLIVAAGKTIATVTPGWVIGDSGSTGMSGCWAWRVVDGTEAAPAFTWTGAATAQANVAQWQGVAASPIGNFTHTLGTGTSATSAAITSTADNSVVHDILITDVGAYNITPPPTSIYFDRTLLTTLGTGASSAFDVAPINISGSTTDTVTYPINSSHWILFSIEILGTGVGTTAAERASQEVVQVPESYSTPVLQGRASQIAAQVPESYSTPVMFAKATQIIVQVLRTQSILAILDEPANAQDVIFSTLTPAPPTEAVIHRKIRDPWDCDEWGRFQPGACIRPIY